MTTLLSTTTKKDFCDFCTELRPVKRVLNSSEYKLICQHCEERINNRSANLRKEQEAKDKAKEDKIRKEKEQRSLFYKRIEEILEIFRENPETKFKVNTFRHEFKIGYQMTNVLDHLLERKLIKRERPTDKHYFYYSLNEEESADIDLTSKISRYMDNRRWCTLSELAGFLAISVQALLHQLKFCPDSWLVLRSKYKNQLYIVINKPEFIEELKEFHPVMKTKMI